MSQASPHDHESGTPRSDEPPLPTGRDMDGHRFVGLHYRRFPGDLFVGHVAWHDVGQGDLGDCYFLASLAAVAKVAPATIRTAVVDHGDGTYSVTFHQRSHGRVAPITQRVDTRFPANREGHQVFGRGLRDGPNGQELWPAVFEKAFAAWQGGYVHLNQGGDGTVALTSLTGVASTSLTPADLSIDALWKRLTGATSARHPMVAGTPGARALEQRTGSRTLGGLIPDHYYMVVDTLQRGEERRVRLYTPLVDFTDRQVATPSARDNAERTIDVPLATFHRNFDQLVINGEP